VVDPSLTYQFTRVEGPLVHNPPTRGAHPAAASRRRRRRRRRSKKIKKEMAINIRAYSRDSDSTSAGVGNAIIQQHHAPPGSHILSHHFLEQIPPSLFDLSCQFSSSFFFLKFKLR
jgi:hypothetical protein